MNKDILKKALALMDKANSTASDAELIAEFYDAMEWADAKGYAAGYAAGYDDGRAEARFYGASAGDYDPNLVAAVNSLG